MTTATRHQFADYSALRVQLADVREQIDWIRHNVYWDNRLGSTATWLDKAVHCIKEARDHSHDWEFRPHPMLDTPCESTSPINSASSSSSMAEKSCT